MWVKNHRGRAVRRKCIGRAEEGVAIGRRLRRSLFLDLNLGRIVDRALGNQDGSTVGFDEGARPGIRSFLFAGTADGEPTARHQEGGREATPEGASLS